jgi:hypothetical protein
MYHLIGWSTAQLKSFSRKVVEVEELQLTMFLWIPYYTVAGKKTLFLLSHQSPPTSIIKHKIMLS